MRTLIVSALLFSMPFLNTASIEAANHYIRADATGNGTGNDWTNACTGFTGACAPSTMVRGDTYYIADGSYGSVTFNSATSGTLVITIKKATVANHGTESGWTSNYGDGQAIFNSPVTFSSSYWTLDGSTRNESSWFNTTAYGFQISNNANAAQRQIIFGSPLSNLVVKYTWVQGRTGSYSGAERRYAIDCETSGTSTNLLFHRMLVTDSNQHWFIRNTNRATIEYSAADRMTGDDTNHGNSINLYYSAENSIIRFNQWRDIGSPGWSGVTNIISIADALNSSTKPNTWIYGNLAYRFSGGDGAFGFLGNSVNGGNCTNCRVYNNTLVDGNMQFNGGWGIQFPQGTGNIAHNNLFMSGTRGRSAGDTPSLDLGSGAINSHQAYGTGGNGSGSSAQNNVPLSIFVSYTNDNYNLTGPTAAGIAITENAPDGGLLNVDMFGCIRGADGLWDRGALEYPSCVGSSAAQAPPAPTNLIVN
ncbi:MAG: hypothetical protein JSR31_06330 [Nitrospira sp.]|nr:hypothetical protein [Nitrospira sp.]